MRGDLPGGSRRTSALAVQAAHFTVTGEIAWFEESPEGFPIYMIAAYAEPSTNTVLYINLLAF